MRVDFYQLGATPMEQVIASLSEKLLRDDERLLVVADDEAQLVRLDRLLWDQGPTSFLPHGLSGGADDARQPVLLSASADNANRARNLLIADGHWRDAALSFTRAFYLFDEDTIGEARKAWKALGTRDGVERHYWANEGGRWNEKASG
ncbi:DNA polymerase III subunit chi [Sphingomonas sabuli]|uniref:DNA polymerase III subunit chi n=1 Tax=Sphingomonas sabuli TaxID=2764186 RepID=A0A7G9L4P6_9SPHN|nr:DNA polymerase III subunit chi [Sphingomonas sabuli]QNM83595.1 DNA polymerase III subunit chi [Sphingomonas sabuli]